VACPSVTTTNRLPWVLNARSQQRTISCQGIAASHFHIRRWRALRPAKRIFPILMHPLWPAGRMTL
jgi:hypothetical protein